MSVMSLDATADRHRMLKDLAPEPPGHLRFREGEEVRLPHVSPTTCTVLRGTWRCESSDRWYVTVRLGRSPFDVLATRLERVPVADR